jgi:two-component system, cell cycle sensor histidine kinase and response regulator CckA
MIIAQKKSKPVIKSGEFVDWKRKATLLETKCEQLKEASLQKEDRFNKLFHASYNLMTITTINDGRIIDINEAGARLGGFSREELIGKKTTSLGLWANHKSRDVILQKLQAEGRIQNLELQALSKAGEKRTILFSADPIIIDGEPCLLSVSVDITDRNKKEIALMQSEAQYRALVENSLQGSAIFQDGHIIVCNSTFAELTGYSKDELLSLPPDKVEELVNISDHLAREIQNSGRPGEKAATARYQYCGIRKNGTEVDMEVLASLIEHNGKPAIQCAVMDITGHKKTAENLQRSLDYQKAIFEGSREPIIISDVNSRFVDANRAACELTGYSKEELLKMEAWELNKEIDPAFLQTLNNRILNGEYISGESMLLTKDGREIDAEFNHHVIHISGEPYIHTLTRDISGRKRLEAQFQQAQKMEAIGVLAGGVAHDFNNLLNVINGYAELALQSLRADHPVRKDIEEIEKAGQRAASLTSQLLAFSRRQVLHPKVLNLNDILDDTNKMLRRLIGEDINLATNTRPNLGFIYADPGQMQQIIMNLAVNARDAMPQGGKLTIETENVDFDEEFVKRHPQAKIGQYVMLAVSDNGIGMNSTTQARIFEPFFTTKPKDKGTGLGLSTVYGIVKQSNGFIWVYSELGQGTTFKVYFQRTSGETVSTVEEKEQGSLRGSETILVVEDEAAVRALASRILKDQGYTVLEASGGVEALSMACAHDEKIDMVLTDVVMPEMSGKELVNRLRKVKQGIEVLFVSGYATDAILHHGILESDVAFLQKPFTIDNLTRKVREVLGSRKGAPNSDS